MAFKRGIFFGGLLVIGSIHGVIPVLTGRQQNSEAFLTILLFYGIAMIIGIIQIISSLRYQDSSAKVKILICCFFVEMMYYVIGSFLLIKLETYRSIKVFGLFIAFLMIGIGITSMLSLFRRIKH